MELTAETRARVEAVLGERIVSSMPVVGGYTPAGRWRVMLADGRSAFAKLATTEFTASALRAEGRAYSAFEARFMPRFYGLCDHPEQPLLVLEDLSAAAWPPPWSPALIAEVRQTLDELHQLRASFPKFTEAHPGLADGWVSVAREPEPFLALGLAGERWLEQSLPMLIDASRELLLDGEELIHFDVRSDNLCRHERGVVLVDWSWACSGNGALDTGFWLPSLECEGGPIPEQTLPGRPDVAAWVSGFFAARAGLPEIPDAPQVRRIQRWQLGPALRWAARALQLPALAGE